MSGGTPIRPSATFPRLAGEGRDGGLRASQPSFLSFTPTALGGEEARAAARVSPDPAQRASGAALSPAGGPGPAAPARSGAQPSPRPSPAEREREAEPRHPSETTPKMLRVRAVCRRLELEAWPCVRDGRSPGGLLGLVLRLAGALPEDPADAALDEARFDPEALP